MEIIGLYEKYYCKIIKRTYNISLSNHLIFVPVKQREIDKVGKVRVHIWYYLKFYFKLQQVQDHATCMKYDFSILFITIQFQLSCSQAFIMRRYISRCFIIYIFKYSRREYSMHTVELQAIIKFAFGKAAEEGSLGSVKRRQSVVNKKTCSVCNLLLLDLTKTGDIIKSIAE